MGYAAELRQRIDVDESRSIDTRAIEQRVLASSWWVVFARGAGDACLVELARPS